MRPTRHAITVLAGLMLAVPLRAQDRPARGSVEVLPTGDVFRPCFADPKQPQSFGEVLHVASNLLHTTAALVAVGDGVGLIRQRGARAGDGVQVSVAAVVFAQFDLATPSNDLLNTDFLIGLPITWRRGPTSARLRVYHQSSHLGDEYLIRNNPTRVNLSFEAIEALGSQEIGPMRLYGGGEFLVRREPSDLARGLIHLGAEFRPRAPAVRLGNVTGRLVVAGDFKLPAERDWRPGVAAQVGLEFGGRPEPLRDGRRWSIRGQFYSGPMPYGQYYSEDVTAFGMGIHFTL